MSRTDNITIAPANHMANAEIVVNGSYNNNDELFCGAIDLTYLKTFSGGDEAFEKDMLESSVSDIDKKMNELKKAFARNNPVLIKIASHSLKSLSSITGIAVLYTIISDIEKNCENASVEQYT